MQRKTDFKTICDTDDLKIENHIIARLTFLV